MWLGMVEATLVMLPKVSENNKTDLEIGQNVRKAALL